MEFVSNFWLPILVSAVLVFIASSILHMVLPLHRGDYRKLPDEDKVREVVRNASVEPGHYCIPHCGSMKDMGSDEHLAKLKEGPVGFMTIMAPGVPKMGKQLGLWFAYCVFVSAVVGYLASVALPGGAAYMPVFRFCAVAGFLAYGMGSIAESIWKAQPWSTTGKFLFDAIVYGLLTAGTFGWRWPAA